MTKIQPFILAIVCSLSLGACQNMQIRPTATVSVGAGL